MFSHLTSILYMHTSTESTILIFTITRMYMVRAKVFFLILCHTHLSIILHHFTKMAKRAIL